MAIREVELTEDLDRFVEGGVLSGRFRNTSEAVREGLLLLEKREERDRIKLEELRAMAKVGFDALERGDYTVLRSPEEIADFVRGLRTKSAVPTT